MSVPYTCRAPSCLRRKRIVQGSGCTETPGGSIACAAALQIRNKMYFQSHFTLIEYEYLRRFESSAVYSGSEWIFREVDEIPGFKCSQDLQHSTASNRDEMTLLARSLGFID